MTIPFVREVEFEYGVVDQVSPMIRRVICNNPGGFTFHGTGTYIIGRGEVAVAAVGLEAVEVVFPIAGQYALETVALSAGLIILGILSTLAPAFAATTYGMPSSEAGWVTTTGMRDFGIGLSSLLLLPLR